MHEIKGRYVVVATVLAGTDLPYYATIKGEGSRAYIRRGPACFEVTDEERRQLICEATDGTGIHCLRRSRICPFWKPSACLTSKHRVFGA